MSASPGQLLCLIPVPLHFNSNEEGTRDSKGKKEEAGLSKLLIEMGRGKIKLGEWKGNMAAVNWYIFYRDSHALYEYFHRL